MSEPNVGGIVELADPENHTIETKITTQSLAGTIKLADPEYPLVGAIIWGVSPAQAELQPTLCWKSQIFVAMATRVYPIEPNVTGIVELADPENHTVEPKITTLSYIQPELWQIFW